MNRTKLSLITLLISGAVLAGCSSNSNQNSVSKEKVQETKTSEKVAESKDPETQNEKYYFTADEGGSISKIKAATNEVVETIEVEGAVHNVQVSPDGKMLGATVVPSMNHGQESETDSSHDEDSHEEDSHGDVSMEMNGKAIFFDTQTSELIKTVEVGNHPAHFVFTEDGKYALVSNNEDNNVSVIDMENFSVIQTIDTGKGPHGFRISADSQKAYVANMNEDTISVLNLESMLEEKKITVGSTPVTTGVTNDGKILVATLNAENMLAIVDLETDQVEKVEVGKGPAQVYIDGNNQYAYVANQGTEDSPSNSVTVVELATKKVTATIETGKGAHGVVTSSDNKRLYVTNMFENTVMIIDTEQNKVLETIEVGKVPNGISIME
ncbi:YncE family protein [Robertmurraya yapensis]|uniref:YncE family protein n=1 Tax=Bacillus yapensis TaxID=2492960 RepID=A0A431VXZ8_9BACI|nr:YncE family protein [Bacillus yapensis]RTR28162.1 YncE family protein [Bacillus yapensis]TKS94405.1 YncE family protein [Bacillus yapensis]